jgi:TRAP-type uncharacterized transport system substrate-binding protein
MNSLLVPAVMPPRVRPGARRLQAALAFAAVVLLTAGAWWAFAAFVPGPPRRVTMATGPQGSAYAAFGERYRSILARSGVDLRPRATAGALENLALLRDAASGVSIAFAQAGTATDVDAEVMASLGTVFHEPLWIFHRGLDVARGYAALRGRRVSIGPEGSGTRSLALRTLRYGGVDTRSAQLLPLPPGEAAERLTRGEIDAAALSRSWVSPILSCARCRISTPGPRAAGSTGCTAS